MRKLGFRYPEKKIANCCRFPSNVCYSFIESVVSKNSFLPVAIDKSEQVPADSRVQFVFKPIGKFIASYRLGHWDDKAAGIFGIGLFLGSLM